MTTNTRARTVKPPEIGRLYPRMTWHDGGEPAWRLVDERGVPEEFPGQRVSLSVESFIPSQNTSSLRCTMLLGEENSGRATFIRRLAQAAHESTSPSFLCATAKADGDGHYVVSSTGSSLDPDPPIDVDARLSAWLDGKVGAVHTSFPKELVAARLVIVLRNMELFGTDNVKAQSARFARWLETMPDTQNIHLVCCAQDLRWHRPNAYQSGLSALSRQYRMGEWQTEDVTALLAWYSDAENHPQKTAVRLDYEGGNVARRVAEVTGGQPLLVQEFLRRFRKLCVEAGKSSGSDRIFARVVDSLRERPPEAVQRWREHLESILTEVPELIRPMKGFVQGERNVRTMANRFPPPETERELYFAGWLGMDSDGLSWGVRSELHQAWAHAVLEKLS